MRTPIHLGATAPNPSRDAIASQIKTFLKSGGKIERVSGFVQAKPVPPRKEPKKKRPRKRAATAARHIERRRQMYMAHADNAAALFKKGMLVSEISRELGISREWVDLCLDFKGIDRDMHKKKAKAKQDEQVEQMRALAAERYTKRYAAQVMGMDYEAFDSLARRRGIRFRELA